MKQLPLVFDLRLFVYLALGFVAFTVLGTLTHESGHYFVSRWFGYNSKIHYAYNTTEWYTRDEQKFMLLITKKYSEQLRSNQPFPGKECFYRIVNRESKQYIWIIFGGPLQTMVTGTIGLILMIVLRKRYFSADRLVFWQWLLVFISLFWLRQAANFAVGSALYILAAKRHFIGDEFKIDRFFHLPVGITWVMTAVIATIVLLVVIFKFIPIKQRLTFISAGLAGGVSGYIFWLVLFGKMIMP